MGDSLFGTVVVGYDGSPGARDALALGEMLTELPLAELIVARVLPWEPGVAAEGDRDDREALRELESAAARLAGRPEVVANDVPAHGLQDLAAEVGADLLVVGSSDHGAGGTAAAGNVGLCLLQGSSCPVAVAPRGFSRRYAPDIRTIAVGYDGSEEAAGALEQVGRLARPLGARVKVIVVGPDVHPRGEAALHPHPLEHLLAEGLAALPGELERSGVVLGGDPAEALLEEAGRDADLLAVGSRHGGPTRRVLLGSVSTELVRRAPCAVLVLPGRGPQPAPSEGRSPTSAATSGSV